MDLALAKRMSRIGTETAFVVLAKAKALEAQGKEIIHLEVGEPDFDTPGHITAAAIKALQNGHTHYVPAAGIPELRKAVAEHVSRECGFQASPDQVVVTPGAKPIMFYSILALCEPGDEVIYPNPGFPIYESMVNFVGARPVAARLLEEKGFRFDRDEFRSLANEKTKLIIFNSPQNPTGGVLGKEDLEVIAEVAQEYDAWVLTDEVYSQILYEGEHISILRMPGMRERTILLDGFSKTFAMTGWRLGYGLMPAALAQQITTLMVNSNSCTAAFTQFAGVAALEGPRQEVDQMVAAFRKRREVIVDGLNAIPGFRCNLPLGAFYAFPNIEGTGRSSQELETILLQEAGVAALSGTSFGRYGNGYMRFSYANSIENIQKALERIGETVSRLT